MFCKGFALCEPLRLGALCSMAYMLCHVVLQLALLNLSHNQVTGTLPSFWSSLTKASIIVMVLHLQTCLASSVVTTCLMGYRWICCRWMFSKFGDLHMTCKGAGVLHIKCSQ